MLLSGGCGRPGGPGVLPHASLDAFRGPCHPPGTGFSRSTMLRLASLMLSKLSTRQPVSRPR